MDCSVGIPRGRNKAGLTGRLRWKAKGEKFFDLDGADAFLGWDHAYFIKAYLLSRFVAYRQTVGGPRMAANEARRDEGMPNVENGETVQQAVSMAPPRWQPPDRGASGQGTNQSGTPDEGGKGDPNRNPADDPAPGV